MRTLYRAAAVYTGTGLRASAVLVEDGVIAWVGEHERAGAVEKEIDLGGALLTPAFVDAHVHATSTGLALSGLDLTGVPTLAAALDRLERAARSARGRPILGSGWDETTWPERRAPTAGELDRAAYGGAVYLARVDVHSAVVSSSLAAAIPGLPALTGYRPDGWLSRDAHDAARVAAQAALTEGQIRDAQRAALQAAAALGIGCVHEMAGPSISSPDDLSLLLRLAAEEPVPAVLGYWGELFGVATARELGAIGAGGDLFCDGSLGSHTAALNQPYADRPGSTGALRFATPDLAEHIRRCVESGLQAGFHAIGDAAIDQVLDAFDLVSTAGAGVAGAGHRLEHAEYVTNPARLAASGLCASMQPMFDALWGGSERMYAERLGGARSARLNRFAELAAAGVPLAFSSDAPVTPLGPWAAVRAAVEPSDPACGLAPVAAFAAHTSAGWRAARRRGGEIRAGSAANLAVWRAGDLDESGLPRLGTDYELPTCLVTIRDGRHIFDARPDA